MAVVCRSLIQFPQLLTYPPPFFFLVVLSFDMPLLSSLCLVMSTVEPTTEGTTPGSVVKPSKKIFFLKSFFFY